MTTMQIDRAVVEQALECLKGVARGKYDGNAAGVCDALEAALAQQANHLTIERLRDALVASRIIPPAAVEDPDEYDDGVTLYRIEALHRRIA